MVGGGVRTFAIDPGSTQSGWAILGGGHVWDSGVSDNGDMLLWLQHGQRCDLLAIEVPEGRGGIVGQSTLDTAKWAGRFIQRWQDAHPGHLVSEVYRRVVKLELCGKTTARDSNVRQAVIDRLGEPGTAKNPGPTHGVKSHAWQALAVGIVAMELRARMQEVCNYPACKCPVDAQPGWCALGRQVPKELEAA